MYNKFDPVMIYAFNNEINLAFFYNDNGEDRYDGNINKILTSIVSYASVLVSKELEKSEIYLDLVFDGHFIEFDIDHEILNYFIWRQFDCKRNTITLLYKSFYNTDDIQDLNLDDMKYTLPNVNDKLLTGNIIKNDLTEHIQKGIAIPMNENTTSSFFVNGVSVLIGSFASRHC